MNKDRILPGATLMIAFCVLAPLLDVASKLATAEIPVGQVTTARFVVQGALMLPVAVGMGSVAIGVVLLLWMKRVNESYDRL